jgi:hypothetical protein
MVFDIEKMRQVYGSLRIGDYVETVDGVCGVVTNVIYSGTPELALLIEAALCGDCIIQCPVIDIPKIFVCVGPWTSEEWKKPPMQQREKHFSATLEPWKHPFGMPQKPDKVLIFRAEGALEEETRKEWERRIVRGIERGAVLLPEFIKLETGIGGEENDNG